jgi:hypothetical protein
MSYTCAYMQHKHNNSHHTDHSMVHDVSNQKIEYIKFAGIMLVISVLSYLHASWIEMSLMQFLESFMGVFFTVFAGFKILQLKEFAYGFQSYDLVAKKSLLYSYSYPFIQLLFGFLYLFGYATAAVDAVVLFVSLLSGLGVLIALRSKQKVHCVCLGNVIKLPLSTISFVEDFGMAGMAGLMLIIR